MTEEKKKGGQKTGSIVSLEAGAQDSLENASGKVHMHEHVHGQTEECEHEYAPGQSEDHAHEHEHAYAEAHMHKYGSGHPEGHAHGHTHTQTKAVLNRLSRAIGHLQSIRRMVEDGRDCSEVLIQISAVRAALNNTGKIILKDHIEHCLVDAIESGDMQTIQELNQAIDQFLK